MNEVGNAHVFALYGSTSPSFYNINEIVKEYGDEIYKALPFTYAFSGCDTTPSFHNLGQCKWFNAWLNCPEKEEIIPVFLQLSNRPKAVTTYQLDIIE